MSSCKCLARNPKTVRQTSEYLDQVGCGGGRLPVDKGIDLLSIVRIGIWILATLLLSSSSSLAVLDLDNQPTGPTGRYIIKLKPDVKLDNVRLALASAGELGPVSRAILRDDLQGREVWQRFLVFQPGSRAMGVSAIASLVNEANIEYVEPEYWVEFFDYPVDSLFANQWYLNNTGQYYLGIKRWDGNNNDELLLMQGMPGVDINISPYYKASPTETTSVVVAIVDSGTDVEHPELSQVLWRNSDEIPYNNIDDDHNGYVDDTLGYDVSGDILEFFDPEGDNDPTDIIGHGTHLAGIVSALSDQFGVAGIAARSRIMPVKMHPNATTAIGAAGIIYAVNAGAQIINLSWGTPFVSSVLKEALDFARANGVFVTIAAGNTADNTRFYPAAFEDAFTIGASNSDGYVTYFSTYGAHIDLVAPGQDIMSLRAAGTDMYEKNGEPGIRIVDPDSLYYLADGTSMSAPAVAGGAAAILSWRPDLTLDQLEELLRLGATDLVDPFGDGSSMPGLDSLSGYGSLNVAGAIELLDHGGLALVEPIRRNRYTDDFEIKVAAVAGYNGSWLLEYATGWAASEFEFLATADQVPADSILYVFADTTQEGPLVFRVTDKHGNTNTTNCLNVRRRKLEILSPLSGEELQFNITIVGNAYGPGYDSMVVSYRKTGEATERLIGSAGEYFDSLLFQWTASGADTGSFQFVVQGYYDSEVLRDSVEVEVSSAFAQGWPVAVNNYGAISPVLADLDADGTKELVLATTSGLFVFDRYGIPVSGFPVLSGTNVRCVPAVYDIDRDGLPEIIFTSDSAIHAINSDGTPVEGWPQVCYTGRINYGYGYPNPTVTRLGMAEDSAIVIINIRGDIMAYEFDGTPYHYSLGGLFGTFNARVSSNRLMGGGTSPFVTGYDVTGDGVNEVIASYAAAPPISGVGIFEGRTGQPAFGDETPLVQYMYDVYGTVLADLDGDQVPEVIALGQDEFDIPTFWVRTSGVNELPGWPAAMPSAQGWLGSYPIAADLDLDGVPEIMATFFEYDVAQLHIFRADGSAFVDNGRSDAVVYDALMTFGTPTVANLTGDEHPEIIFRSGYILPSTGFEMVHVLDYQGRLLPGFPILTPTRPGQVFSSRYAPLVDDLDGDGLVELILVSDGLEILVWDFDASSDNGANIGRFLVDNLNSGVVPPSPRSLPTEILEDSPSSLPGSTELTGNFPNPFNPSTTISFTLAQSTRVRLDVFNVLGQRVITLVDDLLAPGEHDVVFDGGDYASGIYLYRLLTDDHTLTRKMMLLR